MREQDDWDAHARFMDGLVDDGFVLLSEREVKDRLAEDPWTPAKHLRRAQNTSHLVKKFIG